MEAHRHSAGQGAVAVDIGDRIGALVLYTDAGMAGAEIEISPAGDDTRRSHVAVHARLRPGRGPVYAAVYPTLEAGEYRLWGPDCAPALTVVVLAGRVTEVTWAALKDGGRGSPV